MAQERPCELSPLPIDFNDNQALKFDEKILGEICEQALGRRD